MADWADEKAVEYSSRLGLQKRRKLAADLRAAYERGVRAASALFTAHGGLAWRCLDHGGEEADEIARRILALLGKGGGGDG